MMIIQMMLKIPMPSPRQNVHRGASFVDRSTRVARCAPRSVAMLGTCMLPLVAIVALVVAGTAHAASCKAVSGERTTPLVELYTSEGCDSCPPADRWLSSQFPRSGDANRALALAFHVDYWDRLGWNDRFASHAYTERQYAAIQANGKTFVVTPQILLQGHEFPSTDRTMPESALNRVAREPAAATIDLTA